NNELLLQNHENRLTGSAHLPEVNATSSHFGGREKWHERGRGRGRGSGRNQNFLGPLMMNKSKIERCNQCGMEGHWYRACQAKHWVDLYQTSLKEKDKQIDTNF
ncbi:LOW QUALITY PROTEIN: hypothetical protein CFOL_v3_01106, partial [Cephalotus follicularis]